MIIDVSRHQGKIDWDKLAPHVNFAFAKMTNGLQTALTYNFMEMRKRTLGTTSHYMFSTSRAFSR